MKWKGLLVQTHEDVYKPSDDTFLLADVVRDMVGPGTRFLEVGSGAGLVAMVAAEAGAEAYATDMNPHAVRLIASNARANALDVGVIQTDLVAAINAPFDVVAFNPPYLPTEPEERVPGPLNLAFDGGLDGNQTVLQFAHQIATWDVQPARILVIHSSLSNPGPLDAELSELGYAMGIASRQKLPFEELTVRQYRLA